MRRLAIFAALLCATASFAQDPKADDAPEPDAFHRVSIVLDPGWHTKPVRNVFFTPEGRLVTYAGDHTVRITDLITNEKKLIPLPGVAAPTGGAGLSEDGKFLAVATQYPTATGKAEHVVHVVSLPDGAVKRVLKGFNEDPKFPESVKFVAISPDGTSVAATSTHSGSALRLWQAGANKAVRIKREGHTPTGAAFSPDSKKIAVVFEGKPSSEVGVYESATGKELVAPVNLGVAHSLIAWSPDGKMIATAAGIEVRLWSPDLKPGKRLAGGEVTRILSIAFSPDSTRLLATYYPDNHAHRAAVFDVTTGKLLTEFKPDPNWVAIGANGGAFAPDGETVVTAGGPPERNMAIVWNPATGKAVRKPLQSPYWVPHPDLRAAWSADGQKVSWNSSPEASRARPRSVSLRIGFSCLRQTRKLDGFTSR